MSDIEKCIKILRQIYRKKDPNNEIKNFEEDRYKAMYQKILECSSQDRDDLEIIFKCEKDAYERLMRLLGIIPLLISALAMLSCILNATFKPENDPEVVSIVFGCFTVFAIIVFIWVYIMCNRNTDRVIYLLNILERVKKHSKKSV